MAQFMVRNFEDDIHQKLRDMADSHGESLEEFVCQMLRKAALEYQETPHNLGTKIANRFAKVGLHEPFAEVRTGISIVNPWGD